jgi:hypothetical protein
MSFTSGIISEMSDVDRQIRPPQYRLLPFYTCQIAGNIKINLKNFSWQKILLSVYLSKNGFIFKYTKSEGGPKLRFVNLRDLQIILLSLFLSLFDDAFSTVNVA